MQLPRKGEENHGTSPHSNPSQTSPSSSGFCAEPSHHLVCIMGQGTRILIWLQPWSSSSMTIPCSQGKAVGLKGVVKQQKMELVTQLASSTSPASAQDCAATPWHCQRENPWAGHGSEVDLSYNILPALLEPNLAPQTHLKPAGERATHIILLVLFHPERVRLPRQPWMKLSQTVP